MATAYGYELREVHMAALRCAIRGKIMWLMPQGLKPLILGGLRHD